MNTYNPLTNLLYKKATQLRIPLSGTFELSPVCNFSCRMCYVRKTAAQVAASPRPVLTLSQWLEIAEEAKKAGTLYLLLTGGEPLLWPDFWPLYEALNRMGFLVSINTNGSLIDDQAVARFQAMPPHRINLTLYGASDQTYRSLCGVDGVFSKIDHAITALKDAGIVLKLNGSFTPHNIGDMDQLILYAQQRNLILTASTYMFPPIRRDPSLIGENHRFTPEESAKHWLHCYLLQNGPDRYHQYLQNILAGSVVPPGLDESCTDPLDGRIRCRAGKAAFWITWDGWLTPCGLMLEPKTDLTLSGFSSAWKELVQLTDALCLSGVCEKCSSYKLCHPCAAMAQAETGKSEGIPTYLCKKTLEMQRIAASELSCLSDRNHLP